MYYRGQKIRRHRGLRRYEIVIVALMAIGFFVAVGTLVYSIAKVAVLIPKIAEIQNNQNSPARLSARVRNTSADMAKIQSSIRQAQQGLITLDAMRREKGA